MLYPGSSGSSIGATARPPEDDEEPPRRRRAGRPVKQMALWLELPILLVVAFCLAVLIRTFLVQAFFIPSGSMEDTLLIGDRVLVNKVVYDSRTPTRGEVVVFRGTDRWAPEAGREDTSDLTFMTKFSRTIGDLIGVGRPGEKDFIKRVIGVAGDRVSCCDEQGRLLVNGVALDEEYVIENSPLDDTVGNGTECRSRRFQEVVVPEGQIFVMGDHRLVSQDSRCQGPVPVENVVGKAFVIVWPQESWDGLPVPEVWDGVPDSAAAGAASTPDTQGGFVLTVPLLASLALTARSRLRFSARRRRLPS